MLIKNDRNKKILVLLLEKRSKIHHLHVLISQSSSITIIIFKSWHHFFEAHSMTLNCRECKEGDINADKMPKWRAGPQ